MTARDRPLGELRVNLMLAEVDDDAGTDEQGDESHQQPGSKRGNFFKRGKLCLVRISSYHRSRTETRSRHVYPPHALSSAVLIL